MKKRILILALLLSLTLAPINVSASSAVASDGPTATFPGIQPYGNQTGYKYKILNGKLWKRLWSYTYNRWEDPAWTLV